MNFVRAGMQQFVKIGKSNTKTCAEMTGAGNSWYSSLRQIVAMTAIFESSTGSPQAPPSQAQVRPIFAQVIRDILRASPDSERYLVDPDLDVARACAVYAEIVRHGMELPARDQSILFRGILSGN